MSSEKFVAHEMQVRNLLLFFIVIYTYFFIFAIKNWLLQAIKNTMPYFTI